MIYLIYTNEEDAYARADIEGQRIGYSYWTKGIGTRWSTTPIPTAEGKYVLNVTTYDLTDEEEAATVSSFNPVPSEDE